MIKISNKPPLYERIQRWILLCHDRGIGLDKILIHRKDEGESIKLYPDGIVHYCGQHLPIEFIGDD